MPPAATDTNVTEDTTDTTALAVFPCEVAVMVAEPGPTPDTTPLSETVATVGSLEAHVTQGLTSGLPPSCGIAVNRCDVPTRSDSSLGDTLSLVTAGQATETVALALIPSEVAVITAAPWATPVTIPVVETVATVGSVVVQSMDRR